jgi:PAS domain S-box-containing protein
VVDSSADAILSKDCDCRITSWNRGAESLYGYTASEIVGQPVGVLVPADRAGEEHAILDRLVRGDDVGRYETQRLAKDGSVIDVAITVGGDRRVFNPPRHHRAAASKRGAGAASRAA